MCVCVCVCMYVCMYVCVCECVDLIKTELDKTIVTRVDFDGFSSTETRCNKPDICIIDNENGRVFIVEIANPFDHFIDRCYQQKFEKYMPLCLAIQCFTQRRSQ